MIVLRSEQVEAFKLDWCEGMLVLDMADKYGMTRHSVLYRVSQMRLPKRYVTSVDDFALTEGRWVQVRGGIWLWMWRPGHSRGDVCGGRGTAGVRPDRA